MKTVTLPVSGFDSAGCAVAIEKRLAGVQGIEHAQASYVTRSATITYDEAVVDVDTLRALVADCGFACGAPLGATRAAAVAATPTHTHASAVALAEPPTLAAHPAHAEMGGMGGIGGMGGMGEMGE
ncbi:MAG: heavy-metal-associated domain-containing protein, partial [Ktedonobacterales bacterium]